MHRQPPNLAQQAASEDAVVEQQQQRRSSEKLRTYDADPRYQAQPPSRGTREEDDAATRRAPMRPADAPPPGRERPADAPPPSRERPSSAYQGAPRPSSPYQGAPRPSSPYQGAPRAQQGEGRSQHLRPPGYEDTQPQYDERGERMYDGERDDRPGGRPSDGADGEPRYTQPRAGSLQPRCGNPVGVEVFTMPDRPVPGSPLRVIAVSERAIDGDLFVVGPDGDRLAESGERHGGPPYWWYAEVQPRSNGRYRGVLATGGSTACADAEVSDNPAPLPEPPSSGVWPVQRRWDRGMENLFSAWVEKLFDDPIDVQPSWKSLHEITRETSRNFLYDHLGLGEDSADGLSLEPDCADLPYFLRGYFAWKMRLPFGYSKCHRIAAGQPPTCSEWHTNLKSTPPGGELSRVQKFLARDVGWGVHSGTDRTLGDDDKTDVYPTRLSAQSLRPGTVFADPYGHILILVKRIPQTANASGQFLAVDAQPDGTVGRKQFWRGTFLFTVDPKLGGAGFKNFRPILPMDDDLRVLTNQEILDHPDYGDFSMEQYERGADGFYERMDEVLSPEPRPADQVVREIVDSLEQQVRTRVDSVQNGEDYLRKSPGTMTMPKGAAIFQTVGAWEDYATPSRDLRLLIAIDVVRSFPERVARQPRRYRLPAQGGDVRRALQALLEEETRRRTFQYTRSDGSAWTLRLSDLLERIVDLEMAYNPNDCIEIRWGAPEGSDERSTCKRNAPQEQRRRMNHQNRDWFRERRRPST